jgi:hypothetical protein
MQTAMETYYTDEQTYAGQTAATLKAIEPAIGSGKSTPLVNTAAADNYEVQSTSKTGNIFRINKDANGNVVRSCDTDGKFGCPSSGSW